MDSRNADQINNNQDELDMALPSAGGSSSSVGTPVRSLSGSNPDSSPSPSRAAGVVFTSCLLFRPTPAMRANCGAEFIWPDLYDEIRMYRYLTREEELRRMHSGFEPLEVDPITGKISTGSPCSIKKCIVCIKLGTGNHHLRQHCPLNTLSGTKAVPIEVAEAVHAFTTQGRW